MQKYTLIIIGFSFLFLAGNIRCQVNNQNRDSTYQTDDIPKDKRISFEKFLSESLMKYDSMQIVLKVRSILQDSLNNLYELKSLYKTDLKNIQGLDISKQFFQHNKRRDLFLLTSKEYRKNQPNYDLGVVGKYLGISKKVMVIILAMLSL